MTATAVPRRRWIGLAAGPAAAGLMALAAPPDGLSAQGWGIAAVAAWMAIWWMTEAAPLAVTALLPLVLFPASGVRAIDATTGAYSHPLIFLFLGGFLLARAMHVWKLDTRLALAVLRLAGTGPRRILAGVMAVTAFLSMWVSNTATAMVMLPIGLSIAATLPETESRGRFATALFLGIAYAATIGGMGTLVGTPPNALFAGYMAEAHGVEIGFARWMLVGVPLVLILLPLAFAVLTRGGLQVAASARTAMADSLAAARAGQTAMRWPERTVAAIMAVVALLWILRPGLAGVVPGLQLSDAGIAIAGAVLLFVVPTGGGRFLLSWREAAEIRWDVLILFGGGLALAAAIGDSDLAPWLGDHLALLGSLPILLLLLAVGTVVVFGGELASNTATAAVLMPVAGAAALAMGAPAFTLALPVALFATLGFMLPVATPPNAIVFASGAVEMRHMLRAGVVLDVVGIAVVAVAMLTLGRWVFAPG